MNPLLRKLRATPFVALLIFVPLAAAAVSLSVGRYAVHLGDALEIIFRVVKRGYAAAASVDPQERIIIGVRLPRVLLGLLVGGGLSVAGAGMQALLSNLLVSPDTLGVASGACFGAALALILNGGLVAVQLTAMAFGVVAMLITYKAGKNRRETSIIMLVLAGMVVNSLFQAFVSLIKYTADSEDKLPEITYWLLGSLNGATWKGLRLGMPVILAGTLVLIMLRWKCNVLTLSDDEARSLGVDLKKIRALIIVAATAVIASCVSMCGQVGWVGLVVPHACRMLFGSDNRRVIPASASIGAAFMLLLDTVARSASESEIPISILTAVIGAPIFIALLKKTGGSWR